MTLTSRDITRILAIDPTTKGFGFAVLEGPDRLIDWGVASVRGDKHAGSIQRIASLLATYTPAVVVLEDGAGPASRRCPRVVTLIRNIVRLVKARRIAVRLYARARIQVAFERHGARTKYEIASAIAKEFPELTRRLPRFRKAWMPEDERMHIFDAISLGLTFCHFEQQIDVESNRDEQKIKNVAD